MLHNHPSIPWYGQVIPSESDIVSTTFLKWQLALIGVRLTDHYIVSGDRYCSMAEMGCYNTGHIKLSGFEIKRFVYCFLVQLSFALGSIGGLKNMIDELEAHLDKVRHYYEKPCYLRFFIKKPVDDCLLSQLGSVRPRIELFRLIQSWCLQDSSKMITIHPDHVIPYGKELQNIIISSDDNCKHII